MFNCLLIQTVHIPSMHKTMPVDRPQLGYIIKLAA